MATGIEIAGLTLAVFPLVVSGLKAYVDGVQTIGDLWRYQITLKSLIRELKMEKCKFENTCTSLLEGMVTAPELKLLMGSLGGARWGDEDLQEKLKDRLGPGGEECFMEAIEALKLALQALQDDFKLAEGDKPESKDKKALKRQWRGIRLVLSKAEYKKQLDSIAKINSDLVTLTGQSKSTNSSPPQTTTTAKYYGRIRNHSKNIYGVLREKLYAAPACACTAPHSASLRLEVRGTTTTNKNHNWDTNMRFHVVLSSESEPTREGSLQCNWREMGLEPLDSEGESYGNKQTKDAGNSSDLRGRCSHISTAPCPTTTEELGHTLGYAAIDYASRPKLWLRGHSEPRNTVSPSRRDKPKKTRPKVSFGEPPEKDTIPVTAPNAIPIITTKIENLCWATQQAKSGSSCLGVLIDGGNRHYRVWPLKSSLPTSKLTGVVSLENLLTQPGALTTKDRLILGVQLASMVMQLHATEWLSENWGKRDIFFIQPTIQGESGLGYAADISCVIRRPFVRQNFRPPETIKAPTRSIVVSHDQNLFSLGVILMELWYGRCLEDLQVQADVIPGAADITNYVTAKRVVQKIYYDAGEKYSEAARRCIEGLDRRDQNLTTDSFKDEVHKKVVCLLVENLETFCTEWRQELV